MDSNFKINTDTPADLKKIPIMKSRLDGEERRGQISFNSNSSKVSG